MSTASLPQKTNDTEKEGMIRVAHVIGKITKAGVESVVFNYYRFIDKSKIQFDFIIDADSPYEVPDDILGLGCRIYRIPSYKHIFSYIKELKSIFKKGRYKIVHSHMNTLSVFSMYAAKKSGVSVRIAHNHSTAGKGEYFRNILKYFLRPFSKVFPTDFYACSEYAGRWLFGNNFFGQGRVNIINNAIDISKFAFNPETRNYLRNKLGISNKFVLGHVGRLNYQKNHDYLIDIFHELHKQKPESVLLLIGDGELKEKIEKKVNMLGIKSSVLFLGARDDVCDLYQAMDVFVLPSHYEGLPMAAIEAQVCDLPCFLSSEIYDAVKITEHLQFLDLNKKASEWAESILCFDKYKRGSNCEIINETGYVIQKEAHKLEKLYFSAIGRKARPEGA